MVNPGAFRGARKEFLLNEKAAYAEAVTGGYVADALADIQRRFFKRFPIDQSADYEPSLEELAAVDDDAPEPEAEEPDSSKMPAQEFEAAVSKAKERQGTLRFRKAQIKRWFNYQHMKDQDVDLKDSGGDFNNAMIFKLTGKEVGRPRRKTPANLWRKTQQTQINAKARSIGKEQNLAKEQMAALRDKIARDMFNALDPQVKAHWKKQVEIEYEQTCNEWKRSLKSEGPKDASYRQTCISNLTQVAQSFLDWLCENTGWKASLITGGPEPAHGGRLNIISVHSGYTLGDVKMNFGRAERARYKEYWVPIFGDFLKKCYTTEECRALGLKVDTGFQPLSEQDLESGGYNMDRVGMPGVVEEEDAPLTPSGVPTPSDLALTFEDTAPMVDTGAASPPTPPVDSIASSSTCTGDVRMAEHSGEENSGAPKDATPPTSDPTQDVGLEEHTAGEASGMAKDVEIRVESEEAGEPQVFATAISGERSSTPISPPTSPPPSAPDPSRRQASPAGSVLPTPQASPRQSLEPEDFPVPSPSLSVNGATSKDDLSTEDDECSKSSAGQKNTTNQDTSEPRRKPGRQKRSSDPSDSECSPDDRPTKRHRTRLQTNTSAAPPAPADDVSLPPDAPKWFETTVSMLRSADLGPCWSNLLSAWMTFEIHHGFKDIKNLSARHRPPCIHEWIQRARTPHFRPLIQDLPQFIQSFTDWWKTLQPNWRISDGGDLLHAHVNGDLEILRRPGLNGLHSVVAGLFFWASAVKGQVDGQMEWLAIVDDVTAVCKAMVLSGPL